MKRSLKMTLITVAIVIFVCMLNIPVANAASSSITGSKTVTVGESVTITASVNAGAWNLTLSGNSQTKELVGQTSVQGNSSASTSITFTPNKAGTYTFKLSGDMTDYETEVTDTVSKTCTITVKAKTSSSSSSSGSSSNSGSSSSSSSGSSSSSSSSSSTSSTPNFTSVNETVYATGSLNVRASWSTNSAVVGSLSEGQSVTRTGKGDNGWSRVTFNGSTAYIYSANLTTEKPEEKSNNSALKELTLLQGTLSPEFSKDVTEYTVQVGTDVTELQLDAVPEDEKAKVNVEGNTDLKDGENKVTITVTAEDESTTVYTLTVNKTEEVTAAGPVLSNLEITGATLNPTFTPEVYSYTVNVPTGTTSLDITAETGDEDATVEITGNTDLKDGENLITIMIKKGEGEEQQVTTYQITVNVGEQADGNSSGPNILLIICGVAAAIIIIAIIILIVINRKNKMDYDNEDDEDEHATAVNENSNYADELKARRAEKNKEKKQSREDYLNSYQDIVGKNINSSDDIDGDDDTTKKKRKGRHF